MAVLSRVKKDPSDQRRLIFAGILAILVSAPILVSLVRGSGSVDYDYSLLVGSHAAAMASSYVRVVAGKDVTTKSGSQNSAAGVAPEYQLAFEQSLGFFDDIPNDLWISYYQTRARKAEHYRFPDNPNSRMGDMQWTHHWNFFNWDP
jgi:hypothetical protein